MTVLESAVGYLTAWVRRQAGGGDARDPSADQAGADQDGSDRDAAGSQDPDLAYLHAIIVERLLAEPALRQLVAEAGSDTAALAVRPLTTERVRLALQNATEADPAFAAEVEEVVRRLRGSTERRLITVSVSTSTNRSIEFAF